MRGHLMIRPTGCLEGANIRARAIDQVLVLNGGEALTTGTVDLGKRLRPNYRGGKIVLYVARGELS